MPVRTGRACLCLTVALLCIITVIIILKRSHECDCSDGCFKNAAVAADSETCSKIGRDILQSGGSAADGAIAALLCTSVVNPQSTGIGGGSIYTIMDRNGNINTINARESAPRGVMTDLHHQCPTGGAVGTGDDKQWIGVPGEIRGYERAHMLYGRLPWAALFQPTIRLAREGVVISNLLQRYLYTLNNTASPLRQIFSDAEGNILKEGNTVKFEKLADTLEMIAERGADVFYTGDISRDLISDIQEAGGNLTLEDLRSFSVNESLAWNVSLGDYTLYFPPPPAGGVILGFILKVMQGYQLNLASVQGDKRLLTYHRYIEVYKFANGLRWYLNNPGFDPWRVGSTMIQEEFAERIRRMINSNTTHKASDYTNMIAVALQGKGHVDTQGTSHVDTQGTSHVDTQGTSHVSVLDKDGMAVSVTSTINKFFGSKVFSPKTGIILNNELSDFCGSRNQIKPGERPPSSKAPVVLRSSANKHTVIIGGSGGSMITAGVAMTIMNYLWFGKSLKDSIAAPVVFLNSSNVLRFEPDFDKDVIVALQALGHTVGSSSTFFNVVNAVSKRGDCINAVSDARKMGKSSCY